MTIRHQKKNRKYHGTRRWGVGNIKNARGAGDRGGHGGKRVRKKHNFTYMTAKTPWLLSRKGFTKWNQAKLKEIDLREISAMLETSKAGGALELRKYKVLSNGALTKPAEIKASAFSQKAREKIEKAGGKAVQL